MATSSEHFDLIIVGAGVYGIYAANTYLQLHSTANIKVLDSDSNVGGVWSQSRLYPKFWSQSGVRLSGYPDAPFKVPDDSATYYDTFEAKHLSKYLEDYVTDREYDGRSLRDRFVFCCWVNRVQKIGELWEIQAKVEGFDNVKYAAKQIIVATGLSSIPNMPDLPGKDLFKGPILHQKEFGHSRILTSQEADVDSHQHITVLGGSKSAADIVYAVATDTDRPRKVSWIIRNSGQGPLILTKAEGFGKYKSLPEVGSIRAIASLSSANPFLPESWWSWFLHKTPIGEWMLEKIWSQNEIQSKTLANYDGREGALPGFNKLKPETKIRWRSGPIALMQQDDYWDVIARNVQVHRGDVSRLTENAVVLEEGTKVRTDVLLCATGWNIEYSFFDPQDAARLGLPVDLENTELVHQIEQHWSDLDQTADRKVLARWHVSGRMPFETRPSRAFARALQYSRMLANFCRPYMANMPKFKAPPVRTTPYKLYNMTVPINDQSIVFLGLPLVPNSYHTAIAQTLYAIAVLDGVVQLPSKEEMEKHVAFINEWCRRRYPTHGHLGNALEFEMVSYTDRLLEQLGLSSHRNKGSWWADMTDPCLASDYAGLVDEYRKKYIVAE